MASSKCILLRKSTPWQTAVLLTFSVLIANFCGYGIFSVSITALALIISTVIFKISKQIEDQENVVVHQKGVRHDSTTLLDQIGETVKEFQDSREDDDDDKCRWSEVAEDSSQVEELETETISTSHKNNNVVQHGLHSESESNDPSFSSEDSDIDWRYSYSCNFGRSPECSDDSISDEESLIEIAIPSGHFLSPKHDLKKFQNLSEKTFLDQQHETVELFAEINDMYEEDNLIEIDLSV